MAEFTRQTPDVSPNNYVRPGVQDNSMSTLITGVGGAALELDKQLAVERMGREADALRTEYLVGSPAAIAVQESATDVPPLTAADQKEVGAVKNELSTLEAARDQGRMSYETYKVRGERLLRMAIARRPGLGAELRQTAASFLGTDVVGASVDVLASAEQKDKEGGPDFKRMRDGLEAVGIPAGAFSDEQVLLAYTNNMDSIQQVVAAEAKNSVATTAASTMEAGQKLRTPAATVAFADAAAGKRIELLKQANQAAAAIASGLASPEQISQIITGGRVTVMNAISELNALRAQGDIDPAVADREISGLEGFGKMMEELASGDLDTKALERGIKGAVAYVQHMMLDNENILKTKAIVDTFGPEITAGFIGPQGQFNKDVVIAFGDMLANTGSARSRASSAGDIASNVIGTVLDRGGAQSDPAKIPAMADTLNKAAVAFVQLPPSEYKASFFTGASGYLTVLHRQRQGLEKSMPEESKNELAGSVAAASMAHYQVMASYVQKKMPSLAPKVKFSLDPVSGDFVKPTAGQKLTATEQAFIEQVNASFGGKMILETIGSLAGVDKNQAKDIFYGSYNFYKAAQAQTKQQPRATAPTQTGSSTRGGVTRWWDTKGGD